MTTNIDTSTPIVLVTGGSGLVGKALQDVLNMNSIDNKKEKTELASAFSYQWIFLSSKDVDLCNQKDTLEFFTKIKPTYVVHLAAFVGGLFRNMALPVDFWYKNVAMNNNVLYASHVCNVKKVISCLSTCIFPDGITYPITESKIHDGPPHYSNEPYAYAKRMLDIMNRAYKRQYNQCFTSIIPTNIYGPHDNFHLEDSHVIPALIHKLYLAKQRGDKEYQIIGSGKGLRQFIYSQDLAKLILWAIDHYQEIDPIILAPDENTEVSIQDVASMISKAIQFPGKITWTQEEIKDGQLKKTASNAKLRKYLPNFIFTDLDKGIQQTVQWFISNYDDHIRK